MTRTHCLSALGMAWMLAVGGPAAAAGVDLAPAETEALTAPLPPDDPRAQLDPASLDLPEARPPRPEPRARGPRSRRTVFHDLVTGETREERRERRRKLRFEKVAPGALIVRDVAGATADGETVFDPRMILGSDGRVKITNTTQNAYKKIVWLKVRYPNMQEFTCSGSLVASKYVLTNGHCVYNRDRGGWISFGEVVPGLNGTYKPYGSAYMVGVRSVSGWTKDGDDDSDYALITLDRKIGDVVGWFQMGSFSESSLKSRMMHTAGYPGDKRVGTAYYLYGDSKTGIHSASSTMLKYEMDTAGGQSGSPVYTHVYYNYVNYPVVTAVHRGSCWWFTGWKNCGPRLNSDRIKRLTSWISTGY